MKFKTQSTETFFTGFKELNLNLLNNFQSAMRQAIDHFELGLT